MEPSDPFGFLAAEKKLKLTKPKLALASRTNRPPLARERASKSVGASEASSETSHISEAFATPIKELPLLSSPASAATPANQSPRTPTPRRRRTKRRAPETPSSGGADTPGRTSVPSTPSPEKAASRTSPGDDLSTLQKVVEEAVATQTKPGKARGGKGKKSGKSKKSDETLAQEDLGAITEELQALLPSRPRRKPPVSQEPAAQHTRKQVSKRAGPSKKKQKKVRGKQDDGAEIVDGPTEREGEEYVLDDDEREVSIFPRLNNKLISDVPVVLLEICRGSPDKTRILPSAGPVRSAEGERVHHMKAPFGKYHCNYKTSFMNCCQTTEINVFIRQETEGVLISAITGSTVGPIL